MSTLSERIASFMTRMRFLGPHVYSWFMGRGFSATLLSGKARGSQLDLRLLFLGSQHVLKDIVPGFFAEDCKCEVVASFGIFSKPNIDEIKKRHLFDILIRELPPWIALKDHFKNDKDTYIFQSEVDTAFKIKDYPDFDTYCAKVIAKKWMRKLKKHMQEKYQVRESNSLEDLTYFYEKLLKPSAKLRHGHKAFVPEFDEILSKRKKMKLMFLEKEIEIDGKIENQLLAGAIILKSVGGKAWRAWRLGLSELADSDNNLREMANFVMYSIVIQKAMQEGIEELSYGLLPPFFTDGLFYFKTRWGIIPKVSKNYPLCSMKFVTKEGRLILNYRNPLCLKDGKFVGLVGAGASTKVETTLEDFLKRFVYGGLDEVIVFSDLEGKFPGDEVFEKLNKDLAPTKITKYE